MHFISFRVKNICGNLNYKIKKAVVSLVIICFLHLKENRRIHIKKNTAARVFEIIAFKNTFSKQDF